MAICADSAWMGRAQRWILEAAGAAERAQAGSGTGSGGWQWVMEGTEDQEGRWPTRRRTPLKAPLSSAACTCAVHPS